MRSSQCILDAIRDVRREKVNYITIKKKFQSISEPICELATLQLQNGKSTGLLGLIQETCNVDNVMSAIALLAMQTELLASCCAASYFEVCQFIFGMNMEYQQVEVSGQDISLISKKIIDIATKMSIARQAIPVLEVLLTIGAMGSHCLISTHAHILQGCWVGQFYALALGYLEHWELYEINPSKSGLTSLEYLEFLYYSGVCYMGNKKYEAAIDCFAMAITTPALAVSAVVIQCLRKAMLLSLILNGKLFVLPSTAPPEIHRFVKHQAVNCYDKIAGHFAANDLDKLRACVEQSAVELNADLNLGLAQQTVSSLQRHRMIRLTCAYLTMTLETMTRIVGYDSVVVTEHHLAQLIEEGAIRAKIDSKTGTVRFQADDDSTFCETVDQEVAAALQAAMAQTLDLSTTLRALHRNVITSKNYVARQLGRQGAGSGGGHISPSVAMWSSERGMEMAHDS